MLDTMKKRCSVRQYIDKTIPEECMQQIYEAIQSSPTWKNKQCFEVIALHTRQQLLEIGETLNYNPSENTYQNASHVLLFVADPSKSGNRNHQPYYMSDCAIAIEHAVLCAASLNIGSCWVGIFPEDTLKQRYNIPDHLRVVALLTLGYAKETNKPVKRRQISDIIHLNEY